MDYEFVPGRDDFPPDEVAMLRQQLAGNKQLIDEQNRLLKERQEWALHTNEMIRGLRKQLAAVAKERDEIAAQARMLDRVVEERNDQLAAAQAQIDALMLEFCPEEMTKEQLDEWAKNQRVISEAEAFGDVKIEEEK